ASEACVENMALKLTSVYETSSQQLRWDVCVNVNDAHGFSAGIVQFTTGTGSAQAVISAYTRTVGSTNEFTPYMGVLNQLAQAAQATGGLAGDVSGLTGYCDAWRAASAKQAFRDAQMEVFSENYWKPSQDLSSASNVLTALGRSQVFDSTIQLGLEGTRQILSRVGAAVGGREAAWLQSFLDERRATLIGMGGACEF
ncbi:lysozyme-like domain-containing protein, partial [Zopfochytrium polystomum]